MSSALLLLAVLGLLGGFDTLYFHEWRARLPARSGGMLTELKLHAGRDAVYTLIFVTLPWLAWQGWWAVLLGGLFAAEIVITLWDFVLEDQVRKPLGGVYPGERVTHALMAIVYGAMLARLAPVLGDWWDQPSGLHALAADVPTALRVALTAMGIGIALSGLRDTYAATGGRYAAWPWTGTVARA
jgi:hypothetical protein